MTIRLTAPVFASLALAALLGGCGSTRTVTITQQVTATATAPPAAIAAAPATTAASTTPSAGSGQPATVRGHTGNTLTLGGAGLNSDPDNHARTRIELTVTGVSGPFKGYDTAPGRELIGVRMRFYNLGRLHYDDPQPDGTLVLATGETGKQTSLIPLQGKNPCSDATLKLKQGESKDVCIAYDIPKGQKPETFEYVTDDGYGDTGLWTLR
jgi:hypothetical protein